MVFVLKFSCGLHRFHVACTDGIGRHHSIILYVVSLSLDFLAVWNSTKLTSLLGTMSTIETDLTRKRYVWYYIWHNIWCRHEHSIEVSETPELFNGDSCHLLAKWVTDIQILGCNELSRISVTLHYVWRFFFLKSAGLKWQLCIMTSETDPT